MSDKPDDGGPAFPQPSFGPLADGGTIQCGAVYGMSLHDWFAGMADVSAYNPEATYVLRNKAEPTVGQLADYVVVIRNAEADAMIAAKRRREGTTPENGKGSE